MFRGDDDAGSSSTSLNTVEEPEGHANLLPDFESLHAQHKTAGSGGGAVREGFNPIPMAHRSTHHPEANKASKMTHVEDGAFPAPPGHTLTAATFHHPPAEHVKRRRESEPVYGMGGF